MYSKVDSKIFDLYDEMVPWVNYEHFIGSLFGKDKQKTVNEIINRNVSDTLVKNASSCSGGAGTDQVMQFSDFQTDGDFNFSGVKQNASVKLNFSCLQKSGVDANTVKDIQNAIKNDIKQKSSGVKFGNTEQESINKTLNETITKTTIDNTATCVANAFANQKLLVEKVKAKGNVNISNIGQDVAVVAVADCTQKNDAVMKAVDKIVSTLDTVASQESKGIDITGDLANMVGSITGMWANIGMAGAIGIGMCCCICVILCIVCIIYSSKGSGAPVQPQITPEMMAMMAAMQQ